MATSKDLRVRAWESLRDRYWMAFLASLVSGMILSLSAGFSNVSSALPDASVLEEIYYMDEETLLIMLVVILGISLVSSLLGLILAIFVDGPMKVGVAKYYVMNTQEKPSFTEIFAGFKSNYMGNVKVMFLVGLKTALWTLLFIIPGIIKAYEYAVIPYIIAQNPGISSKEAFERAKSIMDGNKWRLFKLEFSFIGWYLLAILTCGVGGMFLQPYVEAARAEFYNEVNIFGQATTEKEEF